jgi:LysM repeat protein
VAPATDDGLVDALPVDVSGAPRAQLVRPQVAAAAGGASVPSGKTYVVQSGDSIWRIANRFGVNQEALMKANGITDARKMKTGMSLVIP